MTTRRINQLIMLTLVALLCLLATRLSRHPHYTDAVSPSARLYHARHGQARARLDHHPLGSASAAPAADLIPDLFTIQIMTYKRPAHLMAVISHLIHAPSLHKIVVIWQGNAQSLGAARLHSQLRKLPKPVEVVVAGSNDVTHRWSRQPPTQTRAVFNVDDDAVVDRIEDLEGAFRVWQQHQDRVIGFYDRVIYWDALDGAYRYSYDAGILSSEKYGMVIGKAWFAGPQVLDLATPTDPLFQRISAFLHDQSRESKGCDDIAWNYFLHLKGAPPPISVFGISMSEVVTTASKRTGYSVRSEDPKAWVPYRHACIDGLNSALGISKPALPWAPIEMAFIPFNSV